MAKVNRKLLTPMSLQQCQRYEAGRTRMALDTLLDFAQALQCSPMALLVAYEDARPLDEIKWEGRLLRSYRKIPTHEDRMKALKMVRMQVPNINNEDEEP